jgi:hypothetical protein
VKIYETYELNLDDLCLFTGPTDIYVKMQHRLIYRVVGKEPEPHSPYSLHKYTLRPVFDLADRWAHPMAVPADVTKNGTNYLVRFDLLTLGRLRLDIDTFIRDEARRLSTEAHEG